MKVADLPLPITASKADWISATTWMGFTPTTGATASRAQCQSTIQRQMAGGYVIEYVTENAEKPNAGFENDTRYALEREQHEQNKGRFLAIHRLRHSSRPLNQIIGEDEFKRLQDMWAQGGKRWRWSVAFPIIESFEIAGRPKATDVLSTASYRRLFAHSSATLRPINQHEAEMLRDLEITRISATNSWIAIEDEMVSVDASEISQRSLKLMEHDLELSALEGENDERKVKIRKRAAWLADTFVRRRAANGKLVCDRCAFDPALTLNLKIFSARTSLDAHHKYPLEEGTRYTSIDDFALLCPTCHRMEHQLLKKGGSFFDDSKSSHLFAEGVFDKHPI